MSFDHRASTLSLQALDSTDRKTAKFFDLPFQILLYAPLVIPQCVKTRCNDIRAKAGNLVRWWKIRGAGCRAGIQPGD